MILTFDPFYTRDVMVADSLLQRIRRHAVLSAAVTVTLFSPSILAEDARPSAPVDGATVQRLIERVDKQDAEIKDLKSKLAEKAPGSPAPTGTRDPINLRLDKQDAEIKEVKAKVAAAVAKDAAADEGTFPTLSFHGFGDVDYHTSSQKEDKNAFTLGELDLFVTSQLAPDISILNEDVIAAGSDNHFSIEIERLLVQFRTSEYLNVDVGRYHTAVGYYNTAFHHGTWFQTAVGRPQIVNFEDSGGVIPVHQVGVSVHGTIPGAPTKLGLSYFAELGNGRQYTTNGNSPVGNVFDNNNYKAVNLAVIARPESLPGVQLGAGIYHDTLNPEGVARTSEDIVHAHLVYHNKDWEFLSEGFALHHSTQNGPDTWSPAFYVQLSRKFGKITPYARFTYLNAADSDQIYQLIGQSGRHYGPSVGVRYDLSDFVALKAQYDYESNSSAYVDPGPTFNPIARQSLSRFTLQLAFTF